MGVDDLNHGYKRRSGDRGFEFHVTNSRAIKDPPTEEEVQRKARTEASRMLLKEMDIKAQKLYKSGTKDTDDIIDILISESKVPASFYNENKTTGLIDLSGLRNRIDGIKVRNFPETTNDPAKKENPDPNTKLMLDYKKELENEQRRAADLYIIIEVMRVEIRRLYESGVTDKLKIAASLINTEHMPEGFYSINRETKRVQLLDRAIKIIEHTKKELEQGKDER